jgi:hypothetical protein
MVCGQCPPYGTADCIPSEDDYDGEVESLEIMSEYLQECFDREDSWYDEEGDNRAN